MESQLSNFLLGIYLCNVGQHDFFVCPPEKILFYEKAPRESRPRIAASGHTVRFGQRHGEVMQGS